MIRSERPTRSPARRLRGLIVDDEPLAREGIRDLLDDEPDITIVGECSDGAQAVDEITKKNPDLVFLDVQMPELNGFEVLQNLHKGKLPLVIFVTAFDEFALRAFRVHAVDYLLKPIDPALFKEAVQMARRRLRPASALRKDKRVLRMLNDVAPRQAFHERIVVRSSGRILLLHTDEIQWIESAGDYICLHTSSAKHLIRDSMIGMGKRLNPEKFFRIHRSTIVHIDAVKELHPLFNGEYAVILKDSTRLVMSRGYRRIISSVLGAKL